MQIDFYSRLNSMWDEFTFKHTATPSLSIKKKPSWECVSWKEHCLQRISAHESRFGPKHCPVWPQNNSRDLFSQASLCSFVPLELFSSLGILFSFGGSWTKNEPQAWKRG